MTEAIIWATFLAIVQMESGGRLNARNGTAVGPAQIRPALVQDCRNFGNNVTLKDRETLEDSYRLFRIYTDRWIAKNGLEDSIQNRANIWRHGPNSSQVKNGIATAYSLNVELLVKDVNRRWVYPNHSVGTGLKDAIP